MKKLIHKIFEAGVHPGLDEFERRSIRLLNRLTLVAFVGTTAFCILDMINGIYDICFLLLAMSIIFAAEQFLARHKHYNAAKILVFTFILVWGIIFSVIVGDKAHPQYMLLPLAMFPLLFFRSVKLSAFLFTIIVSAFILIVYLQAMVEPIVILPDHLIFPYTIVAAFMMMMIIYLLTLYSRSLTNEFEKIITQKNEELTDAYKDIKDSINYAKRLQEAILPSTESIQTHLPDSFIFYKPKDIVAGDFYWFHHNDSGELFLAAADCTGHGVPGAMVSVVCSNALNRAVVEMGITEPGKILDKVRELVIETFEKSGNEVKDGMDISLVNMKKGKQHTHLKWAGANNPLWYISKGEFEQLAADKQPIGKFENARPFTTHALELNENDMLFLFTDGYADQFGGPKAHPDEGAFGRGKKFKYKQLIELLKKNSSSSPKEQMKDLESTFNAWKGNIEQVDDVCIIGIRL